MTYTLKDAFLLFKAENPDSSVDEKLHKLICQDFNNIAFDEVLMRGLSLKLGSNLSELAIKRIERNFNKPLVDHVRTNAEAPKDENGKALYAIYHTDGWYPRFYWRKSSTKIKNKTAYKAKLIRGVNSKNQKMFKAFREDNEIPLLFPITKKYRK